jgi:HEPN domain-containing protein
VSAERLIANLLRVAAEDLKGARLLAVAGNRNAFYLCEQAAEKVIRAVLTSESKHGGREHRLDMMVDDVPDENPLKAALRTIEDLAAYATAFRYPTPSGRIQNSPDPAEFKRSADAVEAVLNEAASRFGVDLSAKDGSATTGGPLR